MSMIRLDYVWLDGYKPTPNIRTKAQVVSSDTFNGNLEDAPLWGFDGSSTDQANGMASASPRPPRTHSHISAATARFVARPVAAPTWSTSRPTRHR